MNPSIARAVAGFLAGALAVLIFHQGMYLLMQMTGMPVRGAVWSMSPVPPYGVPSLVNSMFWGGMWGILFSLVHDQIPAGAGWLKGVLFGTFATLLLGSWLLVPLIKGAPIMAAWVPQRMLIGFLLNGVAFGVGLGLLYPWLRGMVAKST